MSVMGFTSASRLVKSDFITMASLKVWKQGYRYHSYLAGADTGFWKVCVGGGGGGVRVTVNY